MNDKLKNRTISEIIAARKKGTLTKALRLRIALPKEIAIDPSYEMKLDWLIRKSVYNNEDKIELLKYIQKKYRIYFSHIFHSNSLSWKIVKDKQIIDRQFDLGKKSYFMIKGKMSVCVKSSCGLRQSSRGQQKSARYEQLIVFEGEHGLGHIFNPNEYNRCLLVAQNSLILQLQHFNDELQHIQRNCVMTTSQKQLFIKQLNLFKDLNNINKYYTQTFTAKRYSKGQTIYSIDEEPNSLYLIVDGEVQFQSRILLSNDQTGQNSLADLIMKNCRKNYIITATETLSSFNFFGEQQIIKHQKRRQNAKCLSLSCVLLQVSLQKINKLQYYNQFKQALEISTADKQFQRNKKIAYLSESHRTKRQNFESQRKYGSIDFDTLNTSIYEGLTARKQKQCKRISLKDHNLKLVHGNQINSRKCSSKVKVERFSMLEVNKKMYESSLMKYQGQTIQQNKLKKEKNRVKSQSRGARSLKQIWKILKLQNILQEDDKLHVEGSDGKKYYNAHMRLAKHLNDVKSYRPKTIASNCRVKTEYVEYLQKIL